MGLVLFEIIIIITYSFLQLLFTYVDRGIWVIISSFRSKAMELMLKVKFIMAYSLESAINILLGEPPWLYSSQ